ncbi:MAG TPA: response regulator transcription factor, partial [Acidimicrobiales bacterium]|nr:response regulator transcription factor [Acidimicrobiales bacterium]
DEEMGTLVSSYLVGEGYDVSVAYDGATALRLTATQEPDLVLLDIVLGEEDGREVLRELRLLSDVPVIFLTGRGLEAERVAGLKLGADDYVVKPFSLPEVSARIETVLRRSGVNLAQHSIDAPTLRFGDLLINETTHEVHKGGELVPLTSKEFALLAFLAHSPRQVFSREQLLEQVWESSSEWQNEATVTEHVRRLRAKIEKDPDHPRWITTVRGVGYRFEPEGD